MLNPFCFLLKNKKKSFVILLVLVIAVICIYSVSALISSVYTTSEEVYVSPYSHSSFVYSIGGSPISKTALSEIERLDGVGKAINFEISYISLKTIIGENSSDLVILKNATDMDYIIKQFNIKLVDGRLPDISKNEIAMNENVMINRGYKLGDDINTFKLVGVLSGYGRLSLGTAANFTSSTSDIYQLMILPKANDVSLMNSSLKAYENKAIKVRTIDDVQKGLDDSFSSINLLILVVSVMVSVCLSVAVAALAYSIYSGRYDEFGILHALGYKKKNIQLLIFEEMSIISVVSWICGYMLSLGILYILNVLLYADKGQAMNLFVKSSLIYSLIAPLGVILFSVVPTSIKLHNTDLISVIERR